MSEQILSIKGTGIAKIKDSLQKFSRDRRYIFGVETFSDREALITIYDRKPESSGVVAFMETFISRLFVRDRIKMEIHINTNTEGCDVSLSGAVVMAEMDLANPDARPISTQKLMDNLKEISSLLTKA
ncbi:MAG: hypothetical protein JW943_16225 [Deltaproteobacteria bacterium]|nr:hypothetical protein [Deltaproteobacteria bacterium]